MMGGLQRLSWLCVGVLLMLSPYAQAETVLVVSEASPIRQLSRHEVADLFLGNNRNQPQLGRIVPIDQARDELRAAFYRTYLGRSLAQVKAHWAKIIFTGRGYPPRTVSDAEELREVLRKNPQALGYMDRSVVDESLRIISLD